MTFGISNRRFLSPALLAATLGWAGVTRGTMVTGLNYADGYGVFALNSVTASGGGSTGAVAAGGAASFSGYALGSAYASSYAGTTAVIGGNFSNTNGTVNGNVVVGGGATLNAPTLNGKLDVAGSVTHTNYGTYNGAITVGGGFTSNSGFSTNSSLKVGGTLSIASTTSIAGGLDVRGNASVNNPTISGGMRVNGSATITGGGGTVNGGVTYGTTYSGPASITKTLAANNAATFTPAAVGIDFAAAGASLKSSGAYWGSQAATGSNTLSYSTRTLAGTRTDYNVFSMTAADFNFSGLNIDVPGGSTVLINVIGASITAPNVGYTINGQSMINSSSATDDGKVIWNFLDATSVNLSSLGGTVFAPYASVSISNGSYVGEIVANNFTTSGVTETYAAFTGTLPGLAAGAPAAVPEPGVLGAGLCVASLALRRRRRHT